MLLFGELLQQVEVWAEENAPVVVGADEPDGQDGVLQLGPHLQRLHHVGVTAPHQQTDVQILLVRNTNSSIAELHLQQMVCEILLPCLQDLHCHFESRVWPLQSASGYRDRNSSTNQHHDPASSHLCLTFPFGSISGLLPWNCISFLILQSNMYLGSEFHPKWSPTWRFL